MGFFDELKKLTRPYDEDSEELFITGRADERVVGEDAPENGRLDSFFEKEEPVQEEQPIAHQPRFGRREKAEAREKEARQGAARQAGAAGLFLANLSSLEEVNDAADQLIAGRTVLLNLEKADQFNARRLLDFFAGMVYAMDGKLKRVSAKAYLIAPDKSPLEGGGESDEIENSAAHF